MTRYRLVDPWAGSSWLDFDQLRRGMEGMEELMQRAAPAGGVRFSGVFPAVNLYETADGFVLSAELPGLRHEDIELSIEHNRVTIGGERRIDHGAEASVHRAERHAGAFRRTIELPSEVDADKAEAKYRNGVIMLRVPKAERHRPRRISVGAS